MLPWTSAEETVRPPCQVCHDGAIAVGLFSKDGMRKKLGIFRGPADDRKKKTMDRPRVLFVSHEATRTGAPMIVLNILKHFSQNCDVHCETILHSGGHIAADFQKYSEVDCLNLPRKTSDEIRSRVRNFCQRYRGSLPQVAICNSMESRFIAEEVAALGIPILFLVHELPSSYTEEDYQHVYAMSQKVVFPVQTVREAADQKAPIPMGKAAVLPQGLLNPDFGTRVKRPDARKKVLAELSLPENTFLVLGCGTLDLRKGIDHFANICREVQSQNGNNRPIHFVWVGEGPRYNHTPYHYVQVDLEKSNCRGFVHFVGDRPDVEPYFMAADTFLMSSRVDPFPCVIHEAMASGLPIIAFQNSGGAVEALAGGAGMTVPYADYSQTAQLLRMLSIQPELSASMREKSRERVHSRYRFADYGDKLVDLAESICGKNLRGNAAAATRARAA